jgi:hypothetical protein
MVIEKNSCALFKIQDELLIDKGSQNGFLHFLARCYEYNTFVDFLKLFEVVDMDGSFLTRCSIIHVVFNFKVDELEGF